MIRFGNRALLFLWVSITCSATTIVEVQKNESSGNSPLLGSQVTVRGVVTASTNIDDLGAVYIQQPGAREWGGIQLVGSGLSNLEVGDSIEVTGTVRESSGMTQIEISSAGGVTVLGESCIFPIQLDPEIFATWSLATNERYEGMFVELVDPNGEDLTVLQQNADSSSNFGDWRIGTVGSAASNGCRVLTGVQSFRVTSSLNVSYINDITWASTRGTLRVTPVVVQQGDRFPVVRGVITYNDGNLKILPRTNADFLARMKLKILSFEVGGNPRVLTLQWESTVNSSYRMLFTSDFIEWASLQSGIQAQGTTTTVTGLQIPSLEAISFRVCEE